MAPLEGPGAQYFRKAWPGGKGRCMRHLFWCEGNLHTKISEHSLYPHSAPFTLPTQKWSPPQLLQGLSRPWRGLRRKSSEPPPWPLLLPRPKGTGCHNWPLDSVDWPPLAGLLQVPANPHNHCACSPCIVLI